jgi:hypothetical protein
VISFEPFVRTRQPSGNPTRSTARQEPAMHRIPSARAPRLFAAALAAGLTWAIFGGVVSLGASDHEQRLAAVAARQSTPVATAVAPAAAPLQVALAP